MEVQSVIPGITGEFGIYIGRVIDAYLNPETGEVEALQCQSFKLPARVYYLEVKNLHIKQINFEPFVCIENKPQDITPGIFETHNCNKNLLQLKGMEIYNQNLSFVGFIEDFEIDLHEGFIRKIWTTFGHKITLENRDYYIDSYLGKKHLITQIDEISQGHGRFNALMELRVIYEENHSILKEEKMESRHVY